MRVRINPYNRASSSAKLLSELTGWKRLRKSGSRFSPTPEDVIVNWGDSRLPEGLPCRVLNKPQSIMAASNKLIAFRRLKEAGVTIPEYWENWEELPSDTKIVARGQLTGHSGAGIHVGQRGSIPEGCKLYTKYIPKQHEFRVHVVVGRSVFTQRKARRHSVEQPNWDVRNLAGGFVFVDAGDACNEGIEQLGAQAVGALGLDFGAVDVILGKYDSVPYVLEVNTACGLEARTALKYAEALKEGLIQL